MTLAQTTAAALTSHPAWLRLKAAAEDFQPLQAKNGAVEDPADHDTARELVATMTDAIHDLAPSFPHDASYLDAVVRDFEQWAAAGFDEPDFTAAHAEFQPQHHRVDGLAHLVVFPMVTQNSPTCSTERAS